MASEAEVKARSGAIKKIKMNDVLNTIRKDYNKFELLEKDLNPNPFHQFEHWLKEEFDGGNEQVNAMVLSTTGMDGQPDSRVVLLRNISFNGFTFYSNYHSKKGKDLMHDNRASLLFFWLDTQRQIRIKGRVNKLPAKVSEAYFESRPFESKVAAHVSNQSEIIANRSELDYMFDREKEKYFDLKVPKPEHWGGYVLVPEHFEFWQGRMNRLHDRIEYHLDKNNNWKINRLMP